MDEPPPALVLVPTFTVVADLFQPGESLASGQNWLALRCAAASCELVPAQLVVASGKSRSTDGRSQHGQQLHFIAAPGNGVVLAWLQLHPELPWLKAGAVPTYASTEHLPEVPKTPGAFEWSIALPDGTHALLVPLGPEMVTLQLRASGKRQYLIELGGCGRTMSRNYFRWVGDLDADGQPDYLISTLKGPGSARLYLSSAVQGNDLVGDGLNAALADPADEECASPSD
jgi:hypothetical protein